MTQGTDNRAAVFRWQMLTYGVALLLCLLQLRWQALDQVPPAWDQTGYLLRATSLFNAWHSSGWTGFFHDFFFHERGRVALTTVFVQPFFALFGPSLRSAMIPYALAWLPAAWASSGIAREAALQFFGFERTRAEAAGCIAFLLFASSSMTLGYAQNYLVEFPLAVLVAATNYTALAYRCSRNIGWLVGAGLAAGLGLLTKVTFPVFVLPALIVQVRTIFVLKRAGQPWRQALLPAAIAGAVAGPFYLVNLTQIARTTLFLSSTQLAGTFGFAAAYDPAAILNFVLALGSTFEYSLYLAASVGFIVWVLTRARGNPDARFGLMVLVLGFLIPYVFVALGAIKEERYYYPAQLNEIVLAALLLSALALTRLRLLGLAALLAYPALKIAIINDDVTLPPALRYKISILARAPDSNSHNVDAVVASVAQTLKDDNGGLEKAPEKINVIVLAGTTQYCHNALLVYVAARQQPELNFIAVPAFSRPGMTETDALEFIHTTPHAAVLYKTGSTEPASFAALDAEVVKELDHDPTYKRITLPFTEPNACAYDMFVKEP